jgi:hypothetical protein
MIWKSRTKSISVFDGNGLRIKQFWKLDWSDIHEALLKWFKQGTSDNVPVSGFLLLITFVLHKF